MSEHEYCRQVREIAVLPLLLQTYVEVAVSGSSGWVDHFEVIARMLNVVLPAAAIASLQE